MARLHGRNAYLYVQGAGANAVPFSNAAEYSLDVNFSTVDVSQLGDDWVQTIRGQADWSGSFGGPFESSSTLAWDAMVATTVRNVYLYPDKTTATSNGNYYYGQAWLTCGIQGSVSKAVTFSAKVTGLGPLTSMANGVAR